MNTSKAVATYISSIRLLTMVLVMAFLSGCILLDTLPGSEGGTDPRIPPVPVLPPVEPDNPDPGGEIGQPDEGEEPGEGGTEEPDEGGNRGGTEEPDEGGNGGGTEEPDEGNGGGNNGGGTEEPDEGNGGGNNNNGGNGGGTEEPDEGNGGGNNGGGTEEPDEGNNGGNNGGGTEEPDEGNGGGNGGGTEEPDEGNGGGNNGGGTEEPDEGNGGGNNGGGTEEPVTPAPITDPIAPVGFSWPAEDLNIVINLHEDRFEYRRTAWSYQTINGWIPLYDSLFEINAAYAYSRGVNGTGTKIAVVDDGINLAHKETSSDRFSRRTVTTGTGDNAQTWTLNSEFTDFGHGTPVASVAAGERNADSESGMQGVAFGSTVYDVPFFAFVDQFCAGDDVDCNGSSVDKAFVQDIFEASLQEGIDVSHFVNLSLGSDTYLAELSNLSNSAILTGNASMINIIKQASTTEANRAVTVWAAGNDGLETEAEVTLPDESTTTKAALSVNPTFINMLPTLDAGLLPYMVTVVATEPNGSIANFSNRCGDAAAYCIAAPGALIVGADGATTDGYDGYNGTSFAVPHVVGAMAVVHSLFKGQVSPKDVAARVLLTADKSGAYATTATYGQGFLDLRAATTPQGTPQVPGSSSVGGASLGRNALVASRAIRGGLRRALAASPQLMLLDALGHPFWTSAETLLGNARTQISGQEQLAAANLASTWAVPVEQLGQYSPSWIERQSSSQRLNIKQQLAQGTLFYSAGLGSRTSSWQDDWMGQVVATAWRSPFGAVFERTVEAGWRLSDSSNHWRLDLAGCRSLTAQQAKVDSQEHDSRITPQHLQANSYQTAGETRQNGGSCVNTNVLWAPSSSHKLSLAGGVLMEQQQVLGIQASQSDERLSPDNGQTAYFGVRGQHRLGAGKVLWSYWHGLTNSSQSTVGVQAQSLESNSMALGYQWKAFSSRQIKSDDHSTAPSWASHWEVRLVRPLSAVGGAWNVSLPTARTVEGQVLWTQSSQSVSAPDNARLEFGWQMQSDHFRLNVTSGVARPDSRLGAPNQALAPFASLDLGWQF